jgi:hypothetical protein
MFNRFDRFWEALVVSAVWTDESGNDWVLCQVTSTP